MLESHGIFMMGPSNFLLQRVPVGGHLRQAPPIVVIGPLTYSGTLGTWVPFFHAPLGLLTQNLFMKTYNTRY